LIAEGDNKTAIALSVQSNLICPLTAFIAWDESEKVTVANHQLIQPSMELAEETLCEASLFRARPAAASAPRVEAKRSMTGGVTGDGLFRRLFRGRGANATPSQEKAVELDELTLKGELSDLCHRIGVPDWQALLKAVFDWIAQAKGAQHATRITEVNQLLHEMRHPSRNEVALAASSAQELLNENRSRMETLLKAFINKQQIQTEKSER
jgi:hypothetical protein